MHSSQWQSAGTLNYSYSLFTGQLRADGLALFPPQVLNMLARYQELPLR